MRASFVGLLALAPLGVACGGTPPRVFEAGLVSDTFVEAGPYQVRATIWDEDGLGDLDVVWAIDGGLAGVAPLVAIVTEPQAVGVRVGGDIPGAALGSHVQWHIRACDLAGACTREPERGELEFWVGPVPSSPLIEGLAPTWGPESGGTRVEVRGEDFRPGARVRFGSTEARHVEYLRRDLLAATTPQVDPGVVDVEVENPDGETAILREAFAFVASPHLTSVTPTSGPEAGGTEVALFGDTFVDGVRVLFDGAPCRDLERVSDGELRCRTPPGHGRADVAVVHDERGAGVVPEAFRYVAPPRVDAVTPESGTSEGGTEIVVVGSGFVDGTTVSVGGVPCLDIAFVDDTRFSCTTGAAEPGVADVVVTNPDGQVGVLPGGFSYLGPPVVVLVRPREVPIAGGLEVRVLGAGLSESDLVLFAGAPAEVLEAVGDRELVVRAPPINADPFPAPASGIAEVDVTVRRQQPGDEREGTLARGVMYYWPPEVEAVVPGEGPTEGGTAVVVTGRFFRVPEGGALVVRFDGAEASSLSLLSSSSLSCVTPAGDPGPADVEVENHPLSVGVGVEAFFYLAPPRVDAVEPPDGPTFGGEAVTVRGAYFRPGALVFIDGAPCSDVVVIDHQQLTCVTPPGEEGPADVRVINPDGQEDTALAIYRYLGVAVTPDFGLAVGFTRVRVRSAGMQPGARVYFGTSEASCTFVSSREMSCQSPPGALGPVTVRFANPDDTGEDGVDAFFYRRFVDRTAGRMPTSGENTNHIEAIDLDGDGDLDVVTANGRVGVAETSWLYRNDGLARFTRVDSGVFTTANKVDTGDSNADGRPDLLFAASSGVGGVLLENLGDLAFDERGLSLSAFNSAFEAQLVDLVGDDRDDVFVHAIGCDLFLDQENNPDCDNDLYGPDVLLEQTGAGFVDRSGLVPHRDDWVHDHKVVASDLDGDGDNDLVAVVNNDPYFTAENRILRNRVSDGLGFVTETPASLAGLVGDLYDIDAGDLDGDGDNDVVTTICAGSSTSSEVVLDNVAGGLVADWSALPDARDDCDVGTLMLDVDIDGDLDLFFGGTRFNRYNLKLYVNRGDGTFVAASGALPNLAGLDLQVNHLAGGDLDRDRDPDLVLALGAPYSQMGLVPGAVFLFLLE
ncbi:MAG: IPT/TIG domain-containing protein [Deltaproteobacteria bacterium]|nr:IPT/TIG domain-containing protein [Deltaproteobacteria bacterium]